MTDQVAPLSTFADPRDECRAALETTPPHDEKTWWALKIVYHRGALTLYRSGQLTGAAGELERELMAYY